MYLVYRCDWSSGTKNLKDLEDHGDQYNRCFYVYMKKRVSKLTYPTLKLCLSKSKH